MLVTGCATSPEYIYVESEAVPAPRPNIDIDRRELWNELQAEQDKEGECLNSGCTMFYNVDNAFDRLMDWGLENEAIILRQ